MGVLIALTAIALMVLISMAAFGNGCTGTNDLNQDFVFGIGTGFWWKWIADNT